MVSMTALSGVGVAAGGAGVGPAVCAIVFEPTIDADATTSAVNNNFPRPIAVSFSKAISLRE
jgi:hypothetical protein